MTCATVSAVPGLSRFRSAGIRRILVTDSVDPVESPAGYLVRLTLAPLLAEAIRRLKEGRSLEDLVSNR